MNIEWNVLTVFATVKVFRNKFIVLVDNLPKTCLCFLRRKEMRTWHSCYGFIYRPLEPCWLRWKASSSQKAIPTGVLTQQSVGTIGGFHVVSSNWSFLNYWRSNESSRSHFPGFHNLRLQFHQIVNNVCRNSVKTINKINFAINLSVFGSVVLTISSRTSHFSL